MAACTGEKLAQAAVDAFASFARLDTQFQQQFKPCFESQYDNPSSQREVFRWLLETAAPLGGTIVPGYEQKVPDHAQPAMITLRKVLVPPELEEIARGHLVPLGLPQASILAVEDLPMIVSVHEKHGLPAHAFTYLAQIGCQLPAEPQHRGRFTTAKWADWLPELAPHEPFKDWKEEELIQAGLLTTTVIRNGHGSFAFKDGAGLLIELGATPAESARAIVTQKCREELVLALIEALRNVDADWLGARLREAVESGLLAHDVGRARYKGLLPVQGWARHKDVDARVV